MVSHLTFKEREVLYRMNRKGSSKSEIVETLGRHHTTETATNLCARLASADPAAGRRLPHP